MADRDPLTAEIIAAAMEVHTQLGPGLLESSYAASLAYEFGVRGISFRKEVALPLVYKDVRLDLGYRVDFIVDGRVILELKSVFALTPVDEAQLITYLKLSGIHVGLLINFNVKHLRDGIMRRVV